MAHRDSWREERSGGGGEGLITIIIDGIAAALGTTRRPT
jgi:hypothetical protein